MKNINKSLPVILILVISILFRASFSPAPFWVDEFNSGIQAVNLLSIFQSGDSSMYIENNNYFSHFLIAIFFKAFGQSESIARLPFMIAGSLVPVAIYFLAKKLFDFKTAISSALLVSLSYFELAWSNQARGYVLQQLISSLLFLFYYEFLIIKKKLL